MEDIIDGMEGWPFQMLFGMLREMLFGSVPNLSRTWASSKVPRLMGKSIPNSMPVQ